MGERMTRTVDHLHEYQRRAVVHQCSMPHSMIWMDMGLGKSIVTLTSIVHLLSTSFLRGVMIVAPLRVCRLVWRQEAMKWEHTRHLKFSMVMGSRDQRTRALMTNADVYLTNHENLRWLSETLRHYYIAKGKPLPFNGIVWDEVSKMKNSTTHRVEAMFRSHNGASVMGCMDWLTGLTGTPASNGYKDLHGQYYVVDKGKRLGTSKTKFRQYYYHKEGPYKEVPYKNAEEEIKQRISDITLEMSAADYNPLPDLIVNDVESELTDDLRTRYEMMELEMFLRLDSGQDKELFNQASLMNSCLQFSNGAIYPVAGMPLWEPIHDIKLDALEEIIDEANGSQILCAYAYRHDAERILKRFRHLDPINLTECKSEKSLSDAMRRWKSGTCPLMIGHPASMGHGIDGLQESGHVLAWFGLTWSLDLYFQFNARLRRQGQGVPIVCHRITIARTVDEAQRIALESKADTEASLRQAVKEYRERNGLWRNR